MPIFNTSAATATSAFEFFLHLASSVDESTPRAEINRIAVRSRQALPLDDWKRIVLVMIGYSGLSPERFYLTIELVDWDSRGGY